MKPLCFIGCCLLLLLCGCARTQEAYPPGYNSDPPLTFYAAIKEMEADGKLEDDEGMRVTLENDLQTEDASLQAGDTLQVLSAQGEGQALWVGNVAVGDRVAISAFENDFDFSAQPVTVTANSIARSDDAGAIPPAP